ncbi:MAG: NACHT domain-containing protein [Desulfobulbaceae bacterium]|nr:NACHT domain-containing protein [Desulfobulbaceae bacterium]
MKDRFIKSSAIIFGGYLYQNLIGLEFLCDWLEDPGQYKWVKFEADDDETPKGLDDIVALRSDDLYVLLQVKFTVNPDDSRYRLSWDWLLKHKPKGLSLLQKWSNSLFSIGVNKVSEAALITNRFPARDFIACYDATTNRVDFSLVPDDIKGILIEQFGSEGAVTLFFQSFKFWHSHQGYLSLRHTLLDRYVPRHTTSHGWNVLFREAIDWSVIKNFPYPGGQITIGLIRGIFNSRRPEPLTQLFRIPDGYRPPDDTFSNDFLKSCTDQKNKIIVLWGSPGQGKSTYLSYVCKQLDAESVPYLRHHYFLDLADTSDRFSFPEVANSLMAQMEEHHIEYVQGLSSGPENLRTWVEVCANGYKEAGKKFVLIIDGLDHVWRENEQNRQPLDSLFRNLFPVPENTTLLIGTQKVATEQLPSLFPKFVDESSWVELPRMSLLATRSWLESQFNANRFELMDHAFPHDKDLLTELSDSFHRLSGGHPLHLTYSFEALVQTNRILVPHLVDELPDCPEGDIKKYYRTLCQRLPLAAKDALHLVADTGFIWPPLGLEDCLGVGVSELKQKIGHLFYYTEAGQVPFHGSILAFIKEDAEHVDRVNYLLPFVVSWLESKSPSFHRWGWLWLFKARIGQPDDLLNKPDRAWVIDSLAKAYPDDQIIKILSASERLAFDSGQFARAVRIRLLKIRLINGMQFQVDDYHRVYACALTLSDDDYPLRNLSAKFHTASTEELYLLGKQYLTIKKVGAAAECQEQMRKRINDRVRAGAYDNRQFEEVSKQYLELTAATKSYDPKKLLKSLWGFGRISTGLFRFFIKEISKHQDLCLLFAFLSHKMPKISRRDLGLSIVRLGGLCQARLQDWPEFNEFQYHPIVECWVRLYDQDKVKNIPFKVKISTLDGKSYVRPSNDIIERFLHTLFFHVLAKTLELGGAQPVIPMDEFKNRKWLNTAVNHVVVLGSSIGSLLARGENPGFGHVYRLMRREQAPMDYESRTDYAAFRRTLLDISTDVFLLTSIRSCLSEIPSSEWRTAVESSNFLYSEWLEQYSTSAYKIVSDEAIRTEVQDRLTQESNQISEFGERAHTYLELCELAVFQQLESLGKELLNKTLGCVMGYGWRKDMTMSYVLDSIAALIPHDPEFARNALTQICPAIACIDEITDGDETKYTKFEMAEQLIELMPVSYCAYYEYLMKSSKWYDAEEVISKLLKLEPLDSPIISCITGGIWTTRLIGALRSRAIEKDPIAQQIINVNAKFFGYPPEEFAKEDHGSTPTPEEKHGLDVKAFKPENLSALLSELKKRHIYVGERDFVKEWFGYWKTEGQGPNLLKAVEPYIDGEGVPSGVTEILDDAFELSLTLEGKKKAFKWIVAAQIHRHGWDPHYHENEALQRFSVFFSHYADQWQNFIFDTSKSSYRSQRDELVIPHHRLVQFLVIIGQVQLAREIAEQLVSTVVEEVSDQPLEQPKWFSGE